MRQRSLDECMEWPWVPRVEKLAEGDFRLTVDYVRDFAIFAPTKKELLAEWRQALRSHLMGYIAVGKVVPVPEFTVQQPAQPTPVVQSTVVFLSDTLQVKPSPDKLQTA